MTSKASNTVIGNAVEAFKRLKSNPSKTVIAALCDILFFVVYGLITAPLFSKAVDYAIIIGSIVSENAPGVIRGPSPSLGNIIFNNAQATAYLNKIFLIFIILAVAIYVIYSFFQGLSWKLSLDISGKNKNLYDHMKGFAYVNIFWVILFSIQHLLSLYSDIRETTFKSFEVAVSSAFPTFVIVLLFVIFYFAFISYILTGSPWQRIKKSFKVGIKKAGYVVPAYLVIAIVYFIFKNLTEALGGVDISLMMLVGFFTIIPAMTWARVYLTLVIEKVK